MNVSAIVAISADFFTAFAALPKNIQTKVSDFITKFKSNPQGPGINYEKIKDAADKKICSVRIDDTYRGIVVRQERTGIYLLLWIDHHDEAYAWARSKKCAVNKETGNIQVFDIQNSERENTDQETRLGIFSRYSKSDLVRLGVPQEQINYVKSIKSIDEFYTSKEMLPKELYLKASRIGRGTRLDRRKRLMIWNVFNEFMVLQNTRSVKDIDTALYECRKLIETQNSDPIYQSIVVDEGQDFSTNAYKLLRALAGEEHQNDIFVVGDTHQRIYKNHAVLSQCGINIRGRSSYLRINYRTTEEIRRYAFAILSGVDFDDMDGEMVGGKPCQSLTHGEVPAFKNFGTQIEEANYISQEIRLLIEAGVEEQRVCVVARTHKLLGN